jgi:hypothetical protein
MNITTGDGEDWVFIGSHVTIGDGIGVDNLTVNSGAGGDNVTVRSAFIRGNVDIQTYSSLSETDADTVYFDSKFGPTAFVSGNINIRTGGGNDGVYTTDPNWDDTQVFWLGVQTIGSMSVDTGAGDDTLYLRNLRIGGNLVVFAGAGADTLDARLTELDPSLGIMGAVQGDVYVQMYNVASEADNDTAMFNDVGAGKGMTVLMGAGNDLLKLIDATAFDNILLDAGAGNDTMELNNVLGVDNFFALLGEGDDTLNILNLYQPLGVARIDGGAGFDRLNKSGAYPGARLEQTSWEVINGRRQDLLLNISPKVKAASLKVAV